MYQTPIGTHGFNHQSFYRQPVSNLRQINEIVWNRSNEAQQTSGMMPPSFSSFSHQQSISQRTHMEKQIYPSLEDAMKHQSELRRDPPSKIDKPYRERIYFIFIYFLNITFFF